MYITTNREFDRKNLIEVQYVMATVPNLCVFSNRLEADTVLELATDGSGSTVD